MRIKVKCSHKQVQPANYSTAGSRKAWLSNMYKNRLDVSVAVRSI